MRHQAGWSGSHDECEGLQQQRQGGIINVQIREKGRIKQLTVCLLFVVVFLFTALMNGAVTPKQGATVVSKSNKGRKTWLGSLLPSAKTPISRIKKALPQSLGTCSRFSPKTEQDDIEMNDYIQNVLDFASVKRYVMFFGFPRSGHSWIGSCLDASPNAMIANEANALIRFEHPAYRRRKDLFTTLAENSFLCGKYGRVQIYNYSIPGLWQGRVADGEVLQVIGDKKGGASTKRMLNIGNDPWLNTSNAEAQKSFMDSFLNYVAVEPRFIIVLRNPYDMIATAVARRAYNSSDDVVAVHDGNVAEMLAHVRQVLWAKENLAQPHQWHMLTMESFASNTREEMSKLCEFTGIDCPPKLMDTVEERTHHEVHRSWQLVSWTEWQKKQLNDFIQEYLEGYYEPQ